MEQFKILCSREEIDKILNQETISIDEVSKIASFTPYTLVDSIGDLKNSELSEVYLIESKNINTVLNAYIGLFSPVDHPFKKIKEHKDYIMLFRNLDKNEHSEIDKRGFEFYLQLIYLFSGCNLTNINASKRIFSGQVPKKIFSFRQTTAEKWFNDYTDYIINITNRIYIKSDYTTMFIYLLKTISYYLNKSQTFKYYKKSTDADLYEALERISKEFFDSQNMAYPEFVNNNEKIYYKTL